ncbi:MAG: di-trans,poly-cis-decaprenylcistransferase [Bdellovibrionales bacterium]|nr:di-trans,poly-cis-decaprenylcistransferase [Bdellovibrionales bacterium]
MSDRTLPSETPLPKELTAEGIALPKHVAVIMDGNGRWAIQQGKPRVAGHEAGVHSVRRVLEESRRLGIEFVTLYAFSSENWNRPEQEVDALMGLFAEYLVRERQTFLDQDIRLRAIGDRARLPDTVQKRLEQLERDTGHCKSMTLILAVSYGGRDEILRASKKFALAVHEGRLNPADLDDAGFEQFLDTAGIPDPDLLIRTSGEFRISNFLLWQLAYTEIVVTGTLWPDFSREEYHRCLVEYLQRDRRFGLCDSRSADLNPSSSKASDSEDSRHRAIPGR